MNSDGFSVRIKNASLTAFGQTLSGNLFLDKSASGVEVTINKLSFTFGGIVSLTNGTADFTLNRAGLSGSASRTGSINGGSTYTFGGTFALTVGNGGFTVSGSGDAVSIAGQTTAAISPSPTTPAPSRCKSPTSAS